MIWAGQDLHIVPQAVKIRNHGKSKEKSARRSGYRTRYLQTKETRQSRSPAALEDVMYPVETLDIVFSSLTFHYIKSFDKPGGHLVFSVEHPICTAEGKQDWAHGEFGEKLYWPVNDYFIEGKRDTAFLGEKIIKYHRTCSSYLNVLLKEGFKIIEVKEPMPSEYLLKDFTEIEDKFQRPMMLLISAQK